MFYYTYALECKSVDGNKQFYIGSTKDLVSRFREHKNKQVIATKKYSEIKSVYYEACLSKTDSRKREIQLKTGFGQGYLKKRLENYLHSGIS